MAPPTAAGLIRYFRDIDFSDVGRHPIVEAKGVARREDDLDFS
jgi:hypothetical protein